MVGWTGDGLVDRGMGDRLVNKWMGGLIKGWIDGWMEVWIVGWIDGWLDDE
jgi:hypothetical protein